jgi:hypothetical protein
MRYRTKERGFIALISVIIIAAILLVLIFTLEISTFFQRFDALDAENKRVSLGLAEACVSAATLKFAQGNLTAGTVVVDSSDPLKVCKICRITAGGTILTRSVYKNAYTNLSVTINTAVGNYSVTSWRELPSYNGPVCTLP